MKTIKSLLIGVATLVFLVNLVAIGIAAEGTTLNPESIEKQQKNPAPKTAPGVIGPARMSVTPDIAVVDLFVDADCNVKYTLKNKGGTILTEGPVAFPVKLCDKNNICWSGWTTSSTALKNAGGQETFTFIYPMVDFAGSPFKLEMIPLPSISDKSVNNSLTKDLHCTR